MSYLKNAWYLAAWDYEVRDKPLGRVIAEQPIVIFRQSNGELCATGGRCPHRFAPLHMGKASHQISITESRSWRQLN